MTRPNDVLFRTRIETFALIRRLLPIVLLVGALVGPIFVVDPTIGMWLSALCFLVVLVGLHLVTRLPLYPAHTFGIEYRVEEEPFETGRRQCVRCETLVESGTHRRYARQLVVLGVPLHTLEWGSNDFCEGCVPREDDVDPEEDPRAERTADPDPAPTDSTAPETERDRERGRRRPGTESPSTTTVTVDDGTPRLERARRVDRNDETTALELERAFE